MKVEVTREVPKPQPLPAIKDVTLTLSEGEARKLRTLVGDIAISPKGGLQFADHDDDNAGRSIEVKASAKDLRAFVTEVWQALERAGIRR